MEIDRTSTFAERLRSMGAFAQKEHSVLDTVDKPQYHPLTKILGELLISIKPLLRSNLSQTQINEIQRSRRRLEKSMEVARQALKDSSHPG